RGWSFCSAGRSPTYFSTSRPRTRSCGITASSSANATSSVRCARCKHIAPGRRDQYDKRRVPTVAVCKQNAREITAPPAPDCHSYCYSRRAPSLPALFSPAQRSEEHTSELQSLRHLVCRLLLEKKKAAIRTHLAL